MQRKFCGGSKCFIMRLFPMAGHSSQGRPHSSQGRPHSSLGRPASASDADSKPKGVLEAQLAGGFACLIDCLLAQNIFT